MLPSKRAFTFDEPKLNNYGLGSQLGISPEQLLEATNPEGAGGGGDKDEFIVIKRKKINRVAD